jgi:AcrR family transcriptional regulator
MEGHMPRQRAKTEVRREQIARAALELVARGGLRAFSMAKLARRVGIAPSAIYRHFPGKDDVLVAALERFRQTVLDNVAAVRRETPRSLERLRRLVARQARLIRRNATIMPRLAFAEESAGVAAHARRRMSFIAGLPTQRRNPKL